MCSTIKEKAPIIGAFLVGIVAELSNLSTGLRAYALVMYIKGMELLCKLV